LTRGTLEGGDHNKKRRKEWIDEKRKAGIGIFTTVIRLKAKPMAKARNIAESEFKALVHWQPSQNLFE